MEPPGKGTPVGSMHLQSLWLILTSTLLCGCIDGFADSTTEVPTTGEGSSDGVVPGLETPQPVEPQPTEPTQGDDDSNGSGDDFVEGCGNGVVEDGESCDDGDNSPNCDADCTFAQCGDLFTNAAAGEDCDGGGVDTFQCNFDCTKPTCGDGYLNTVAGEKCEPGEFSEDCDIDCTEPACGDGVFNPITEFCESNLVNTPECDADCTKPECGDGFTNAWANETCDDIVDTALCNAETCAVSKCGDHYVNAAAGEECDDGEDTATCDSDCTLPVCGDGYFNEMAEDCEAGHFPPDNMGCLECKWVCKWGFGDCNNNLEDGCEHSVLYDSDNCGSCGTICPIGTECVHQVCEL